MLTARVYGIYINEKQQVLVSDELIRGKLYSKFPGGGLEFGEGTRDCLVREFKEEMDRDIIVKNHIYSTDFFVESAFAKGTQVLSIYYEIDFLQPLNCRLDNQAPSLETFVENNPQMVEQHRLVDAANFLPAIFQLPIDKVVVEIIKEKYF